MNNKLPNELLLLMVDLTRIQDPTEVARVFAESLSKMFDNLAFEYSNGPAHDQDAFLELSTPKRNLGRITPKGPWDDLSPEVKQSIRNAVSMVAVIMENLLHAGILARENDRLEETVARKTDESIQAKKLLQEEARQALQDGTEELEPYFMSSLDLLCIADKDGFFRRMNPAWEKVVGYSVPELEGRHLVEFAHPEDRAATEDVTARLKDRKKAWSFTHRFLCKDGSYRWLEWRSFPRRNWIYAMARDVTGRIKVEQALKESEARFRSVLETMPIMMDAFDDKGHIIFWNRECERVTGFSAAEIVGNPDAMNMLYPDESYRAKMLAEWRERGDDYYDWEWEIATKSGEKRIVAWSNLSGRFPIPGWASWGFGIDITDRKETETALRASQAQLANAVEMARLGPWELDEIKQEFTFNDQFYKIFRTTAEQTGGYQMSIEDYARSFVHPDDISVVGEENRKALETDDPNFSRELEHRIIYADGEVGHISVRFFIAKDESGRTVRTYGVNQDITKRKMAEDMLRASEERFRTLFQHTPVSVWEEDFSDVKAAVDKLKESGVADFEAYFSEHREELRRIASMIKVLNVNEATSKLYEAEDKEALLRSPNSMSTDESLEALAKQVTAMSQGKTEIEFETVNRTISGRPINVVVRWAVVPGYEDDYSLALLSVMDITAIKETQRELGMTQALLLAVLDQSPVPMTTAMPDGTITVINDARKAQLGIADDPEMKPGVNLFSLQGSWKHYNPDGSAVTVEDLPLTLALRGIATKNREIKVIRKDGTERWQLVHGVPIYDPDGKLIAGFTISSDITELKQTEKELRESEQRYKTLFERAGDGIIVVAVEGEQAGKIISANRMAAEMHGYDIEEFLQLRMSDLDTPEEARRMRELFHRISRGEVINVEHWHRKKDGTLLPIELNAGIIEMGDKKYSLSVNRDITGRKKAEAERLLLATAVEQVTERVEISDPEGNIVYVNPAFEKATGYSRAEALGAKADFLGSGLEKETFLDDMWSTLRSGAPWSGHIVSASKDGKQFEEKVTVSPVKDSSGKISNYVAVKRDVTNEALLQKQLLEAQKMEAIGTLAGGIAHDFNNLLQIIQGYADAGLLDMESGQIGYSELLEIKRTAWKAAELTRGLLTFSRKVEGKLGPVELNKELRQICQLLERTISKAVAIELILADDLLPINADPGQLHQLVVNLAINAKDAMQGGGAVVIETANVVYEDDSCRLRFGVDPGRYVMLSVSDTGCGMDKATMAKIFDPFFTTKDVGKGTGLGLSIVFGIVKAHGGAIICESEPGEGATFKIHFQAIERVGQEEAELELENPVGGAETILLVDDEDSVRSLAANVLRKFGYTVLMACNGKEAVELFRKRSKEIDLVIMDLIMPEMDGRESLREILRLDPSAKALIVSGYGANGEIEAALKEGAKHAIKKPYDNHQLLEAIRNILDE